MKHIREDGYRSAVLGKRASTASFQSLSQLYAEGGLYARIVDKPADDAMKRGITIKNDDAGVVAGELGRLNVCKLMADALRWARLSGGDALLVMTDTGQLNEELPESFGNITEVRVIERDQITVAPGGFYSDPSNPDFGNPEMYQVTPITTGLGVSSFYVHESRIIPISGKTLPGALRSSLNVPWMGGSSIERAYESIQQYERSLYLALETLKRKQQAVHKMKGLVEDIESGNESFVRQRVDLVDEVRSLMNGVAVDAEDDYRVYDLNLSGIKDILSEFQVKVSADSEISVSVLFGRSAGGLNNTGENDLQGYYALPEMLQQNVAQPALEKLINFIGRQSGITLPADYEIEWPSLWMPSDQERADTRLKNAQADQAEASAVSTAIDAGVIDAQQGQEWLEALGRYRPING